ncbi:MAG: hypothetical protein KJ559_01420 [Nanoarchaeota archaeon]|nr:hypothetical protein [Nanoarchaeota archaeon]
MRIFWKLIGEYFFISGLSLFIAGMILKFNNPLGLIISGILLFFIGVITKIIIGVNEEVESGIPIYLLQEIKKYLERINNKRK